MIVLKDILQAKERRWQGLNEMLAEHKKTVLSVSLNIPGQEKASRRVHKIFQKALDRINHSFAVNKCMTTYENTGPHALFCVEEEPVKAKIIAYQLEEAAEYTRLWDIDVYDSEGTALSHQTRSLGRKCFLCEKPSFVCMREKSHTHEQIIAKIDDFFIDFHAQQSNIITDQARILSAFALEAILYETACTPAPGLVCPKSNGSHDDMNFFTFLSSSSALSHHLSRFAQAGLQHEGEAAQLFPVLKKIGLDCEKTMFAATKGVNTQKGLIFSMGLALGASGLLLKDKNHISAENISEYVRKIAKDVVKNDLLYKYKLTEEKTAGEHAFDQHFIEGIRGEAEAGFPSIINTALPVMKNLQQTFNDTNKSLVTTLFSLMQVVNDTTVLKRGQGLKSLEWLKEVAKTQMDKEFFVDENWQEQAEKVNKEFIARRLSPGGSADLLALCWYFYATEKNSDLF